MSIADRRSPANRFAVRFSDCSPWGCLLIGHNPSSHLPCSWPSRATALRAFHQGSALVPRSCPSRENRSFPAEQSYYRRDPARRYFITPTPPIGGSLSSSLFLSPYWPLSPQGSPRRSWFPPGCRIAAVAILDPDPLPPAEPHGIGSSRVVSRLEQHCCDHRSSICSFVTGRWWGHPLSAGFSPPHLVAGGIQLLGFTCPS